MKQNNASVKKNGRTIQTSIFTSYVDVDIIAMAILRWESHNSILFDHTNGNYSISNRKGDESVQYCHLDQIPTLQVTSITSLHFVLSHIKTLSVY